MTSDSSVMHVGKIMFPGPQCSAAVFWARVHIFVLGHHLGFSNCGGLSRGDTRRGSSGGIEPIYLDSAPK